MKELRWQHVVLVLAVVGAVTFLVWQGNEGTNVVGWLLPLLVTLGVAYQASEIKKDVSATRDNTNGNVTELMRQLETKDREHRQQMENKDRTIKEMANKLAEMQPPPKD